MAVYTAPLARIKVVDPDTQSVITIGKMRNIRVSETIRRGRVTGIGQMTAVELPALEFTGTINVGFYTIDFSKHPLTRNALLRKTGTSEKWVNTVLLNEIGLRIDLIRTVPDLANFPNGGKDANGIIQTVSGGEVFATIEQAFITSDGFDVSEGQVSGQDSTLEFLDPITFLL